LIGLQRRSELGGEDTENDGTNVENIEGGKEGIKEVSSGEEQSTLSRYAK